MKVSFNKLTDKQRKHLVKLRLANEHFGDRGNEKHGVKITQIKVYETEIDRFSYIIYTKEWHPECSAMILKRVYLNEVKYLIDQKIISF